MMTALRFCIVLLVLGVGAVDSKRMPGGKVWTLQNLNLKTPGSYCYGDAEKNCRRYGRLYTWAAAQRACPSLGSGWRLPGDEEWHELANHYGGIRDESADMGHAAFQALFSGGSSGFNAVLGGSRSPDGREYARLDAHGLYWTATETAPTKAWVYNFGKGGQSLGRHRDLEKTWGFAVRCVRD
jgi:uncharacterized protein (TIGR02145 family)